MHKLSLMLAAACLFFATNVIAEPEAPEKTPEQKEAEAKFELQLRAMRALNAANGEQYDQAAKLAEEVLAALPTNAAALYARALVRAHRDRDFDGALKDIDAAIANGSSDAGTHATKAGFLVMKGDAEGATALLRKFVSDNPADSAGWNVLADHCLYMEDSAEAEAAMAKAVELAPAMRHWWLKLSQIRLSVGNYVAARASAERAVELMPDSSQALAALATANMELGELETALRQYSTAVAMSEPDVRLLRQRADCYERMGRLAECVADLGRVAQLQPDDPRSLYEYGSMLSTINIHDDAERQLRKCEELAPGVAQVAHARLRAMLGMHRYEDAQKYLDALPEHTKRNPRLIMQQIDILEGTHRHSEASAKVAALQAAMGDSPLPKLTQVAALAKDRGPKPALQALESIGSVQGYEEIADSYRVLLLIELGELEKAKAAAKAALEAHPKSPRVMRAVVSYRAHTGDSAGAIALARELVALSPFEADDAVALGTVCGLAGQAEHAREAFTLAIRIDRWSISARLARAGLLASEGKLDEARMDLDRCLIISAQNPEALILSAWCYARQLSMEDSVRELAQAESVIADLEQHTRNPIQYAPWRAKASCIRILHAKSAESAAKDIEVAIGHLQAYRKAGFHFGPGELESPIFEALRELPEFKALSGSKE